MAGRKNKLDGTTTGHRTKEELAEKAEVEAAAGQFPALSVEPPEWLNELAKAEYMRVAPTLEKLHVTTLDQTALALYANAYSNYVTAARDVDLNGQKDKDGKRNVSVGIMSDSSRDISKYANSLGLTLDSRMKIIKPTVKEADDDPFMNFGDDD